MDNKEPTTPSSSQRRGNAPLVIPQLLQASTSMSHIDEMLAWLANVVVQRLDVQVVQFWATQASPTGQLSLTLRTNVCEDTSLPQYVIYNPQIIDIIGQQLRMHRSLPFQPINSSSFPHHQASLFLRYGLNYSLGYFLSSPGLLPPDSMQPPHLVRPAPCEMFVLLLLRHSLTQELFVAMEHMFEQAILIAARRGFLLAPTAQDLRSASYALPQQHQLTPPPLSQLIPRRLGNTEAMKAENPFAASSPAIKDRNARRLYQAIDGKRTVAEIAAMSKLKEQDMNAALQLLLKQKVVQLYTAEGQPFDGI